MNVHFSYKISKTPDLEKLINQQVEKLGRYLQVFRPELVHLKGIVEDNSARQGVIVSLNLRLPSTQMASQESSPTSNAAIKAAFDDIAEQLKKHKELLRHHHKWPRRGSPGRAVVETVPFEDTLAAVKPEKVSSLDITNYVNVNLGRLQRSIERELRYREDQHLISPGQIETEDVVGEAIANALSDQFEKPERVKLEPWIHRLAMQAIDQLAAESQDEGRIPLQGSPGEQDVEANREVPAQFQPDDKLFKANLIPDTASNNPEELAARREQIDRVETTLRETGREQREAFILYTIEGFTVEEISDISQHTVDEVRAAIRLAGDHLQRALPGADSFKDKLLEYSKSA